MSNQELSVAEDIVRYASENQIDEIVIGLRRRSQLGKLLFGSTSRQVILDATCPVLCIK
jgi:nucleotide-binding universal stress UspA family protein